MSNSLDSFLTRIGDVTIERVTPRGGPKSNEAAVQNEPSTNTNMNNAEPQTANEESSEESSGESSDGEQEKKHGALNSEDIEEIRSEGSGDDMDLDETIDSQIGVRVDSERQSHCPPEEDDEEPVNILDTLPLEGAPIEGQEVSEADLLGKPISKDTDDESVDNEKTGSHSGAEDGGDGNKRHGDSEHSENVKKKQKKDDGTEESTSECETKAEKKLANMRRNIREVMDETQLDEATLSAQRQEMERLRRVQEQQRIIREVQRQMTINRQNNKTQTRVISLLQGKQNQSGTTISQSSSSSLSSSSSQVRLPNTVLLKVNSGSGTGSQTTSNVQSGQIQRKSIEGTRWQKGRGVYQNAQTSISRVPNRSAGPTMLQQRIRMMTPSVSISPVVPKKEPIDRAEYYSDSDVSDIEAEEALREKHMHLARKMSSGPKSQKVAKGKDVVTISSSSESSDDDCIVLSDPSGEEETDNEDDPSNSGMHTNDRYNIPDEHGRVLINVGHPETEPDVFLAPQVARIIKPHQIGGIRFLYDNIVESIERYKTSSGFGCILAHSMGLGKTLQVASFCDIFFRCTTAKTVLCIMPINTLQNWLAEFNMWLPYEDPTSMGKNKITSIKSESEMESKSEIKEECGSQSDMSNISRPISTESAHRYGQENVPQSLNIMPENPYTHQGYENHIISSYVQDSMLSKAMPDHHARINQNYPGDITQSSMYNTNPNSMSNFDPMKPELNCHAMQGRPNIPPPNMPPLNIPPPNLPPPNLPPPNLPPPNLPPPNLPPPNLQPPNLPPPNLPPPNLPPPNLQPPNLQPPNLQPPNLQPPNLQPPNLQPPNLPPPNLPPPNLPPPNLPPPNLPPPNLPPPNLPPPKFGMENQNSNMYTTMENQSQGTMYSDMENRSSGPMYPNNHHQSGPIYPNYNNPPNTFPNYTNQHRQDLDHEPKKENILHQNTEVNVKREPEDAIKKEEGTNKEEIGEDKKNIEKVKTTYMVDAPIGMELRPRHFRLHILNDSHKTMTARAKVIQEWQTGGGVLLIGYELYRQLSMKKPNKAKRKRGQPFKDTVDVEEEDKNKGLLDEMHSALVSPGPDLVICDEGHRIKNSHASISMALKQMRTKRRIVLTGYPLQNNLLEYWCMVDFVRPNYLGTKSEFCNMFERPIQNGQCIDSTPQDIRLMRYRAHVLHALLEGFVQRRSHSVLQVSLPRKEEYILLVRMTPHQRKLYDTFMNQVVKTRAVPNPLKAFAVCCKIWNHPDILYYFLRKRQANEEDDLDLEETIGEKLIPGGKRSKARQSKGESKKGKKTSTTIKNKPAASVQPNPSSSNVDNTEGENTHSNTKQNNYTNYSMPTNNSGYSNSMSQQAPYPGYQNYRSNDQNTYYRNDNNHGEYNEFYNNQQRYGNQPFPTYTQNTNYNSAQGYNNQSQNYIPPNDQSVNHPQRYPAGPPNSDFRPDQNQGNNYETSGIYPRQPYTYPDQGRNYGTSVNQGPNNYSQVSNQTSAFQAQLPNQSNNIPVPEYSPYAPQNQAQNYGNAAGQTNPMYTRNDNQPLQTSALGYTPNQGNQNTGPPPQTGGYLSNQQGQNPPPNQSRGFSPNQQNQNLGLQNSSHAYGNQQTQAMPHQNQQHGYPTQVNPNSGPQTSLNFNQQTSNSIPQNQSHGYMTNQQNQAPISQNQMRGYPPASNQINVPQNATYPQNQTAPNSNISNQVHGYSSDQQGPNASTSNPMHGYPHLVPSSNSQNSSSTYPPPQQSQQPAAPPNQNHGYTTNHQGSAPQNSTHRYNTGQQGQISQPPNQALSYSQNQPSQNSTLNQNDQLYPRNDNQQQSQNYTSTNAPHEFPNDRQGGTTSGNSTTNYPPNQTQTQNPILSTYPSDGSHQSQVGQIKGPDDPYWQRDYSGQPFRTDQCNDTYYRDPNVNRFQNNYFPSQSYSNQSYDYAGNHNTDVNSRPDDPKTSQASMGPHIQNPAGPCDKSNKDMPPNMIPNQSMHQSNLSNKSNYNPEGNCPNSTTPGPRSVQGLGPSHSPRLSQVDLSKDDEKEKEELLEKDKDDKSDDEILTKDEEKDCKSSPGGREDPGIPYDWATELMKGYVPGLIDASAKMTLFFCILEEAIRLGDRVLAFSQSLFTLNLIEDFLSRNSLKYPDGQTDAWIKNVNYYRLDGSTSALEREKLINEFNNNPKIHLFLVSTRAGSLGINLVGANRAIVFDASWNPCHDTQAVCRVYRYGQQKPCFVYRLVTDNCLERKIYDRQISKQGMADRVVDQCNPDAHLSLKDATTLSWDWEEDSQVQDFSQTKDSYSDEVMHRVLECHSSLLTKQPFHHESLLVDRKDKKLSQAEKRLARRGYELEKMAANCSRPSYNYVPGNTATRAGGLQIRAIRGGDTGTTSKPVASVRPMQQRGAESLGSRSVTGSRWIPAEVWQRQGMSAQEMTLPLDVVIPTNSPDKGSIVLKAGQRVMVLKSPKGIYMQLESGKIIAIRTALKLNQQKREEEPKKGISSMVQRNSKPEVSFPLRNNSAISIIPKSSTGNQTSGRPLNKSGSGPGYRPFADKEISKRPKPVATAAAKPYLNQVNLTNQVSLSRLPKVKQEPVDHSTLGENSNSSDGQVRTEQRVEEVRLEDVVAEVSSNTDYSPATHNRISNSDTDSTVQKSAEEGTQVYIPDNVTSAQSVQTQHDQSESELSTKVDKQCSQPEEKEPTKVDAITSFNNPFSNQNEKRDTATNDDIIIEEQPHSAPSTSVPVQPLLTPQPVSSAMRVPSTPSLQRSTDASKNVIETSSMSVTSVCTGTNTTTTPKILEPCVREAAVQGDPANLPQGYPYAQYPRYYDYTDPRSRSLPSPYGTYFPGVPTHTTNPRLPVDTKPQSDVVKPMEDRAMMNVPTVYSQVPSTTAKTLGNTTESKTTETTVTTTVATVLSRDETHIPTAFSHPTSTRYPGPYPPGPYDPYSQHYPPAPGSTAAYPPGGAPGYPAYGGPTYNTDYARMYSAFHGPPPPADPYMHRGYAPPSSHPPNYYPPFPHPPPPYPNYSFLSPYPNPNMPSEPQPPAQ